MLGKSCAVNRKRLFDYLKQIEVKCPEIVRFVGGETQHRPGTDTDILFRQESNFIWMFGVLEPNYSAAFNTKTGETTLFAPKISEADKVWLCGDKEITLDSLQKTYGVEHIEYAQTKAEDNSSSIDAAIRKLRLVKNEEELGIIRLACATSAEAHKKVMRQTIPDETFEYQQANLFAYLCQNPHQAYLPICGSGRNEAILHYGRNNKRILDGDLCLLDMGTEYCGYASDITITFPANGTFTAEQASIYTIVLEANRTVISKLKSGVCWGDMQNRSFRIIFDGLASLGFFKNNEYSQKLVQTFMPHGLGHHLGIDVHDGRLGKDDVLEENMVVTVEPGIYFIWALINKVSEQLNMEVVKKYVNVGGVRIEDDIIIKADSAVNMTLHIPRNVLDVEGFMKK
jgi:Xaa-Pro dipeptidase